MAPEVEIGYPNSFIFETNWIIFPKGEDEGCMF